MAQPTIAELLMQAATRLRAEFEYVRESNPHAGEKGQEAEKALRDFLSTHLPGRFKCATGIAIDWENQTSRQTDILIYDGLSSLVYRAADRMTVVPANAVAAAIEVKSSLDKTSLEDAYAKIASVKQLKKRPLSNVDQFSTSSEASTTSTLGVVFAYSASTSLETLASHVEALNRQFDSSLWPELIIVLDVGVLTYAIAYPGQPNMEGSFIGRPPPGHEQVSPPPWYVHLVLHKDGDLAFNRFWGLLHVHLTFYPYRPGPPPSAVTMPGASKEVLAIRGYWFDSSTELQEVPESMFHENNPTPPATLEVFSRKGQKLSEIEYVPWADAAILRAFGPLPLGVMLDGLVDTRRVLALRPDKTGAQLTTLVDLSEEQFRNWPAAFENHPNLVVRLKNDGG